MERQSVEFDVAEWLILSDLIKANPEKYQDKDHKGTDVYNLLELTRGCSKQVMLDGSWEDSHHLSLVTKLNECLEEGHQHIEFRPRKD